MKLYEIETSIEEALEKYYECFDENGELIASEEDFKTIENELLELQNKRDEFLQWILKSRANTISDINGITEEIKRLADMKSKLDKKVLRSEILIERIVKPKYNGKTINYGNWSVGFKPSKKTIIQDEDLIPEKYKKKVITEEIKIPLTAIKKDIEAGIKVPGAIIQENMNLQIK